MAQSLYEAIEVGTLQGRALFSNPRHKRSKQVDGIVEAINFIPPGSGEDAMLALIDGGDHSVTVTARVLLRSLQRAEEVAKDCAEARLFLSPENLAVLDGWGSDPRNAIRFSIRRASDNVTTVLEDRSRATLATAWPRVPDVSMLRTIIAAGVEFDGQLARTG